MPALQRLLRRANRQPLAATNFEATVLQLFQVPCPPDQDLPVAALTRLADGGTPDRKWWLRADPVHLRADLNDVVLFDGRMLDISAAEADDLVAEFNAHTASGGEVMRLESLSPQRWYLQADSDPGLRTTPLAEVIGHDINAHLPSGNNRKRWNALLTEIQMLFHASEVNAEREWDDQHMSINGIWLWGGGVLPEQIHPPAATLFGRDPLTRGLAIASGRDIHPQPVSADAWLIDPNSGATSLVVLDTIRFYIINDDPFRWSDRLRELEQTWFAPCVQMLKNGLLDELTIHPCAGTTYTITRGELRRFWRRAVPLQRYLFH